MLNNLGVNMAKNLKDFIEIEFLKSLSYEEINAILNDLNAKIDKLSAELLRCRKTQQTHRKNK